MSLKFNRIVIASLAMPFAGVSTAADTGNAYNLIQNPFGITAALSSVELATSLESENALDQQQQTEGEYSFRLNASSYSPNSVALSEGSYSTYDGVSTTSNSSDDAISTISSMIATPSQWKTALNEVKDELTFSEKIEIASYFGEAFGDDYNYERDDSGEDIVTVEEMLTSLSSDDTGGVCRDVALAQAQILTSLGVDKSSIYIVAYYDATGRHSVLAVEDADDPDKIIKFNYGYTTESGDVKGGAALTQDTSLPDFGMYFRVYDSDGDPVARVPSEIGQIFNEVTSGDYGKRDIAKSYALQKAVINTPFGNGTLFTGETSAGDEATGIAINQTMKSRYVTNEIGVSAITREGDRTLVSIEQQALYLRLKSILDTPSKKYGDRFSINGVASAQIETMYMNNTVIDSDGDRTDSTNEEFSTTFATGLESFWQSQDHTTLISSELIATGNIDLKNEVNLSEGYTLAFDNLRWTTNYKHDVGEAMQVQGTGSFIVYNLGATAILEGKLNNVHSNWSASAAYQAPIDELPVFMPGSSETLKFGVKKSLHNANDHGLDMSLEYIHDLDYDVGNAYVGIGWTF